MITVSDYIIEYLLKIGVSHVFMVSGGGAMYLNDAVAKNKKIKYVSHHHEQAAAIAAEVYSRVTQNFGAAMVTTGPSGTNAVTGVLNAWQDSTPCIIVSGQDKKRETIFNAKIPGFRQLGAQEVNIIPIVESITKYAILVNEREKIRYYLEKAVFIAKSGRPGPVWLDIPLDVQGALIEPTKLIGFNPQTENLYTSPKIPDQHWGKLIGLLKSCRKPLIVAGNGIRLSKAADDFLQLVQQLKIPFVTSNMAIDLVDHNNRYFIGVAGQKGQRAANIALQNADLLISIGCRLSVSLIGFEYDKFAPSAKKIVVDIDPVEHQKKTIKIDLFLNLDAKLFIKELLKKTRKEKLYFSNNWVKTLKNLSLRYPVCLPEYAKKKSPLNIYFVVNRISDNLKENDIVISDAGFPYYMVAQGIKIKKGQRFILPGATAGLGYSLPASTGAGIAAKKRRIICITGDGSFQTNIHELGTIVTNKLPVKIFVLNNGGYLSIRTTQKNYFNQRFIGESKNTGLGFPDTGKIAQAYGLPFYQIKNARALNKIIPQVLRRKGPVLCEISCLKWQAVAPTVSSKRLPDGSMVSTAIDDMFPFLPDEEMKSIRESLK